MPAKTIAIAGFQHETNTFCPFPTSLADFECQDGWPALTRGAAIPGVFAGLNISIGGFVEAAAAKPWDLVPIVWASAEPAAHVSREAFETICDMICEDLRGIEAVDGVYLDLHGAMVAEDFDDGEAEILRRVRAIVGEDVPVVCSLDFHANISRALVDRASALAIYRHYPHTDMAETGARAADLLETILAAGKPLKKAFRQIPYLVPLSSQGTTRPPFDGLYAGFELLETGDVTSVDAAAGFTSADIRDCGPSVLAYGTSQAAVDDAVSELYERFIRIEPLILDDLLLPGEAVAKASDLLRTSSIPVVLADVQDNPGAGGTCDTTGILDELIRQDCAAAIVGLVCDAAAVGAARSAGLGGRLHLALGNAYAGPETERVAHAYEVEHLGAEPVRCTGTIYGGSDVELGPMALLRCTETAHPIRVVLTSRRFQCLDRAFFLHVGHDLAQPQIVVVKSTMHFLADFEPIAQEVLFVEAPGANPCRLENVDYRNLRPGLRRGPFARGKSLSA